MFKHKINRHFFLILSLIPCTLIACNDGANNNRENEVLTIDANDIAGFEAGTEIIATAGDEIEMAGNEIEIAGIDMGDNEYVSPSEWIDMECLDGQFSESINDHDLDIMDLFENYDPDLAPDFIYQILARRYPFGEELVRTGRMGQIGDCLDIFLRDRSSPEAVIRQVSTIVHECGHFADIDAGMFRNNVYLINDGLTFSCQGGDAVGRGNGKTFARSLINRDEYALEACRRGPDCDFYRSVYLDGDPDNSDFEGGDQGYNSVLEETAQYINSIAVGYAFHDYYSGSVSERDGILTFLWYITRYLKMAREDYPEAYEFISTDPCWRELLLTLWGRAWLYLELTEGFPQLGINDEAIQSRINADLVGEIDRIRNLECP